MNKVIIFIGPPFAGKETQTRLLSEKTGKPVFSMGALIRKAYQEGDSQAIEGFENYSMKGLHIPTALKFKFIKEKMDSASDGFILDNFPATKDDLSALLDYMNEKDMEIEKVFLLEISSQEMLNRMKHRGRKDDREDIVLKRREEQDKDREELITHFDSEGLMVRIDGGRTIEEVQSDINRNLGL